LEYRYYDENKKLQSWCNNPSTNRRDWAISKALTQVKATSTWDSKHESHPIC
jgi:hypothetical protein